MGRPATLPGMIAPGPSPPRRRLAWPLPALLVWVVAWASFAALRATAGESAGSARAWPLAAVLLGCALVAWAWPGLSGWRRLIVGAGFPLSLLASGAAQGLPAWAWSMPLALLLAAYPLRAWRDAPLFPTPPDALRALPARVALPPGARVLDAGCGAGHGLRALHAAWPDARLEGIEFSWPLRLLAGRRCRFARVRQGDMWRQSWAGYQLVYLFQRPESMARAWQKAQAELVAGAWLVSLAFEVPGLKPTMVLKRPGMHTVWLYQIGERGNGRLNAGPPQPISLAQSA